MKGIPEIAIAVRIPADTSDMAIDRNMIAAPRP